VVRWDNSASKIPERKSLNIGVGITAGFVLYPLGKLVTGKIREIKPGLWILTTLSLLFFIFYPYG
jgi:AGZA family xanthine/uracil permease-like MFS transporter